MVVAAVVALLRSLAIAPSLTLAAALTPDPSKAPTFAYDHAFSRSKSVADLDSNRMYGYDGPANLTRARNGLSGFILAAKPTAPTFRSFTVTKLPRKRRSADRRDPRQPRRRTTSSRSSSRTNSAQRGINIRDPRYGAWWDATAYRRAASVADREELLPLSVVLPSRDDGLDFGRQLSRDYRPRARLLADWSARRPSSSERPSSAALYG